MSGPSAQADVECSEREQACTPEVAAPGAARPEAAEHEASAVGAEGPEAAERGVACSEAVGPGSAEPVRVTSGGVNQVTAKLRRAGTMLMCGGISSASLYFLIAAAFFWSSRVPLQDMSSDKEKAPEACNRDLESLFHWLGLWNGILGIVSALFACTAHELHNALTHSVLARKFRSQGRYEEALEQQEEYMDDIRCATRMVMVPSAFYILATASLVVTWIWGFVQCFGANDGCSARLAFFWLLLVVDVSACCISLGGPGGARLNLRGSW
mmetsp:Transcript_78228/g.176787  ORF Transcript_78228/g.176787 Transcript_78228/m.176787 type:complete len:269 (-) Transcript_78228:112-918(-)